MEKGDDADTMNVVDGDNVEDNDIRLDSSTDEEHENPEVQERNADRESDSSDDDDESDVDLAADAARMDPDETIDEEDETGQSNEVSLPPTTANEYDAYRTPIQELEKHLQLQLTVDPDGSTSSDIGQRNVTASSIRLAGKIKHFMALDRTVVVESSASNPHGHASSFATENAPLDEGTLLLLRSPPSEVVEKEDKDDESYIPLGRIFEVFGPVSKPLYTIRLPTKRMILKNELPTPPEQSTGLGSESTKEQDQEMDQAGSQDMAIDTKKPGASSRSATTNPDDPWALGGKYSILLQQNNDLAVYYVHNEAKLLDMGFIAKISRKGCGELLSKSYQFWCTVTARMRCVSPFNSLCRSDASNLYDEEVVNTNEMYYSDDEEERQAKNRKKKGLKQPDGVARGGGGGQNMPTTNAPLSLPSGFHPMSPSNRVPYNAAPLPEGFHQTSAPIQNRRASRGLNSMMPRPSGQPSLRGREPTPPQPPPNSAGPPPAYQY
jgi:hypothetical protein